MQSSKWQTWMSWLSVVSRLILGAAFVLASVDKISTPARFAGVVDSYKLLPDPVISPFAIALPWVELIAGSLLLLGVATRSAAFVVFCLLLMFLVAISLALARHLAIDCGCFETLAPSEPIGWSTIVRDVALILLAIHVLFFDRPSAGLEYLLSRRFSRDKTTAGA